MNVLGISCFYHDAAASLVVDGEVVAAAAEERFSREKHDKGFPSAAVSYCLEEAELSPDEIDEIVFYEKPIRKFHRILETTADVFPRGFLLFSHALPEWMNKKLRVEKFVRKEVGFSGPVTYVPHHQSHAASAFYPSPFEEAAVLTVDGIGEWKSNELFVADKDGIEPLKNIRFPDSIGLLYSALTAFLGFMVNNDEYKVMGLASYGEPCFREEFDQLVTIYEDGAYTLDQGFFAYTYSQKMWGDSMTDLLGEPRKSGEKLTQRHKDIAATLQEVLEEVLMKQVNHLYDIADTENLCMAGGVALNSAANGKIQDRMPFDNLWIQPAAGDDGGSMGAALERSPRKEYGMEEVYLGPRYGEDEVIRAFDSAGATYERMETSTLIDETAARIANGEVIGLYQGRMEWGPRALGNRSIIADPRDPAMVDRVNERVKFREEFRPFAPTVLQEHASEYFEVEEESPYMLFVFDVKEGREEEIPAVTHVDGTSRIQTLREETNPFFYGLIDRFHEETGVPVVLNTSFNLKGMPIVNTPEEAYDCFTQSGMDALLTPWCLVTGGD